MQGARQGTEDCVRGAFPRDERGSMASRSLRPVTSRAALSPYSTAPSLAVPCPGGSSFPVGLIAMSHARISSAFGFLPRPYVGDCVHPACPIDRIMQRRGAFYANPFLTLPSLPTFHGCTLLSAPRIRTLSSGSFQIFRNVRARRLDRAKFVGAARHQHALFTVPVPVEPESCMRHRIRGRPKLGIPSNSRRRPGIFRRCGSRPRPTTPAR